MSIEVSIVLSTYNRPLALKQVLLAFNQQTYKNFEIIIADDGSDQGTENMIKDIAAQLCYSMQHVWQEDKGFRAARSRNRAIKKSQGRYIIFVDGDCLPGTGFISDHMRLAEQGWMLRGSRIMIARELTEKIESAEFNILNLRFSEYGRLWLQKKIKRISPLFRLPMFILRKYKAKQWQGVKTCNLGVWKTDLIKVNGFNEQFEGWGHEDAELAVRLFNSGVRRKEGLYAVPVFHLWHKKSDRCSEGKNMERLQAAINSNIISTDHGLN